MNAAGKDVLESPNPITSFPGTQAFFDNVRRDLDLFKTLLPQIISGQTPEEREILQQLESELLAIDRILNKRQP